MLKKIDRGRQFLEKNQGLFACPLCHETMTVSASGLICSNNHRFDLSKKGTLYFLDHQIKTEYDQQMFTSRQKLIKSGMYQPLLEKLQALLGPVETLLDVGCGEGSFLDALMEKTPMTAVGFDISKEGIYLATNQPAPAFWCIADLTNLPFGQETFSTILNIFSPSNYGEFKRVLKADGKVIKVIPRQGYLQELRQAFYPEDVRKQTYSNQPVIEKFCENFPSHQQDQITYQFDVPEDARLDLLEMSPLEWGVTPEVKAQLQQNPLNKITIDLDILIGEKN